MTPALQLEIEVVACPLCMTRDHERTFLDEGRGTRFVRCERCRSVYLNPRPGAGRRSSYYRKTDRQIWNQAQAAVSRAPAFQLISTILHRYKQSGAFLDVGCNTGALFAHFDCRAWRRYGIEPDRDLAEFAAASHSATVHAGTLDDAEFLEERFDVATMIDIICLLPDPLAALTRIHQLLKPGGVLAVEFAGQAYMLRRSVGPLNYLFEGRWSRLRTDGRHLYFFAPEGMQALLATAGFTVLECIPIPSPQKPGWGGWLSRLHFAMCRWMACFSRHSLNYCPKLLCIATGAE
jgi:SAM-dependent methyltransferase